MVTIVHAQALGNELRICARPEGRATRSREPPESGSTQPQMPPMPYGFAAKRWERALLNRTESEFASSQTLEELRVLNVPE